MKVKELIAKLQELNQEAEVLFSPDNTKSSDYGFKPIKGVEPQKSIIKTDIVVLHES